MKLWRRIGKFESIQLSVVGLTGDKATFEELFAGRQYFRGCPHCNGLDASLAVLSNISFWTDGELNEWFTANKAKSQDEWIQAGFRKLGFEIHLPPTVDDIDPLLRILGKQASLSNRGARLMKKDFSMPHHARINAYRWLKDMGFDQTEFIGSNPKTIADAELLAGLKSYGEFHRLFTIPVIARSSFAVPEYPKTFFGPSPLLIHGLPFPALYWGTPCIVLMMALGGLHLMRITWRTAGVKSTPASPTSHPPDTAGGPPDH